MHLAVGHILIDLHLSVSDTLPHWVMGIVEFVFDHQFQFLIHSMSILNLMMHAGTCTVILGPGLLLDQRAVVQWIRCIVTGSNSYPHWRIDHRDIFLELNAILHEILIISIKSSILYCLNLVGQSCVTINGAAAMSIVLHSNIARLGIDIRRMISSSLNALL